MQILLVANGYPPAANGGVETYTFNLAHQLFARGHNIQVLCRYSDFSREDFSVVNEIVDQVPVTRIVNDFKDIEDFEWTYRSAVIESLFDQHLVSQRPDLIHFNHVIGLSSRLPEIAARAGIPSIYMIHDFWLFCSRTNLVDWKSRQCGGPYNGGDCFICMTGGVSGWEAEFLRRLKHVIPFGLRQTLRKRFLMKGSKSYIMKMVPEDFPVRQADCMRSVLGCNRILAPSDFVRRVFARNGYSSERIEVVPLGIDRPTEGPAPSPGKNGGNITFAYIGSLLPAKGLDLLLRSFSRLYYEQARLFIFGDDKNATPEFKRMLTETIQSDTRVKFLGPFTQAQRTSVYQQIDVLVLPSRQPETFSLVAREALIHKRPVISVEAGALPEIISAGVNGMFFPPDDETALLHCLEKVCANPDWLNQFEIGESEKIPLIDEHAAVMENIYRNVLNSA